ncbi:sucrose phosphorylase, partial [Gilvimarinus sp. 1_MG-2023]|nr:sucrose phosphorylase [Gilvimarinus sp. 1_MG-2023]
VLPDDKIRILIDNINDRSADPILRRSAANIHSVGAIYQLTCTFYDALMQNDDAYIAARTVQFFTPGTPQVYYVGLLAGENDHELMEQTGELRDINRHYYSLDEVAEAVQKPVVK